MGLEGDSTRRVGEDTRALSPDWSLTIKPLRQPKVSIIILNWNSLENSLECLASLKQITYLNYEVMIVDNASSGNDVKVLRERYGNNIDIIENDRNYGFAEGNNIGIRYALKKGAEYVLILHPDMVVDREFLDELVKVAEVGNQVGMVFPLNYSYREPDRVIYPVGLGIVYFRNIVIRLLLGVGLDIQHFHKVNSFNFPVGSCILIKTEVLHSVGFLDPQYFFGGHEDIDLWHRAARAGFRSQAALSSKVWHKEGATVHRKLPYWYNGSKGAIYFVRKNFHFFPCLIYLAIFVPLFFLQSIVSSRSVKQIPTIIRGMRDGFAIKLKS
ncbi:glycosyltransferase family 2 protein [Chloroflexota bacterium]